MKNYTIFTQHNHSQFAVSVLFFVLKRSQLNQNQQNCYSSFSNATVQAYFILPNFSVCVSFNYTINTATVFCT